MLVIWSLVPLPFPKPAWSPGSSWCTYCWSLAWRILNITLLAYEMSAIMWYFEHSLALFFFGIGMKTLFPVLWPLLSFPNLLSYWVQHFRSIIFQDWNSSTGIPSPLLALFIVMLSKAHLTSHSRMSGSRSVITSSWLSWFVNIFFVQFFCVFLPPLLNIFCFR